MAVKADTSPFTSENQYKKIYLADPSLLQLKRRMKKFALGFICALVSVGLIYAAFTLLPQLGSKKKGPLYDQDVQKAKEAVICDNQKHSCASFDKTQDSGSVKVTITAKNNPVKGLEVDVAAQPGAPQYYVKLTDGSGIALFSGLPRGSYTIYFNGVNFPKEYGNSPVVPVEIVKNQTTERTIDLTLGR